MTHSSRSQIFLKGYSTLNRQKILIVDDNPKNRAICEEIFEEDFDLIHAEDGAAALRLISERHPDVVLLDVMMPGINGYEVCQRIKADAGDRTHSCDHCFRQGAN